MQPDNHFERILEGIRVFVDPQHGVMPVSGSDVPVCQLAAILNDCLYMREGKPMDETHARTNVIDLLIADHRAVDRAFEQLEGMDPNNADRGPLAELIITELVRHAVAEEQYLYPTMREKLEDGDSLVDHHLQEHDEAEELMKQLEQSAPASEAFTQTVSSLASAVRHHTDDEENDLLGKLRQACDASTLEELGAQVEHAKERAATRLHPSAPDEPPMDTILTPGVGLVDRVREALGEQPQ